MTYAAPHCNRFRLAPKCSIRVVNSSHVTMKNDFVVAVRINNEEKIYTPEQHLPLPERLRICLWNEKHDIEEPAWLKQYYNFENLLSLSLLSPSVILELVLLIVYLARKRTRNIPEKDLIAFVLFC